MYLNSISTVHRRWRRSNALALIVALIAGAGALWLGPSPAHAANPATVMATTQRMTAATLQADQHGTYAAGRQLTLVCHARGQSVQGYYSPWVGRDNLWYQVSDGFWVADVDINTGSNDPIVSACPTINTSSWYLLTAKHSGKAIDVRGAGRVNGTAVQQYTTNRSAAQYFRFAASGSGFYQVVNQLTNTQVWDAAGAGTANGTKIVTYGWAGGRNQQWRPVWDSSQNVTLQPRHAVTKCLDVPGGSTADSVQLQLWDCNGTAAQKFTMSSGTVVAPVAPRDNDYPYKNAVSCGTSAWCISGVAFSGLRA